eukprot:scaffold13167_cov123-Isochrysis_galbana.AAC.10
MPFSAPHVVATQCNSTSRCRARSARPDGAKRGRHCLVWTRLARSSQQRPTNGNVLAYRLPAGN